MIWWYGKFISSDHSCLVSSCKRVGFLPSMGRRSAYFHAKPTAKYLGKSDSEQRREVRLTHSFWRIDRSIGVMASHGMRSNKAEKEIRVHNGSVRQSREGHSLTQLNGAVGWFYWFYKLCTIYLRKICEQSVRHLWANVIENNNTSPPCLALDVMNTRRARALCMEVYLVPRAR